MSKTEVCWRCGGAGLIREFSHIYEGKCFQCAGKGTISMKHGVGSAWQVQLIAKAKAFRVGDRVRYSEARIKGMIPQIRAKYRKLFGTVVKPNRFAKQTEITVQWDGEDSTRNQKPGDIELVRHGPRRVDVAKSRAAYAKAMASARRYVTPDRFREIARKWAERETGESDPGPEEWAIGATAAEESIVYGGERDQTRRRARTIRVKRLKRRR